MTNPTPASLPFPTSIVVGVDDSPESLFALDLAATIGAPQGARLTIVHVRQAPAGIGFSPAASIQFELAEDELDALVRSQAANHLDGYAGEWQVAIRSGHASHQLLSVADEVAADLVVVGHRGHGAVRDAILGSVASSTVHHSRRSVLVAVPPTT